MRKTLILTSFLTFLFTSSIWAADISGTWVLKYEGRQGDERVMDMVIKAAGENLTVTTTHPSLGEMAGTGTLKGNDILMTLTATGERKVGFELKGTVTGNKMAGTREVKASSSGGPEGAQGGSESGAQRGARGDSSGGDQVQAQRGARGDSSGGEQGQAQRGDRGDSSGGEQAQAQRGARGDSSGGEQGQAQRGERPDSSKETSNTWTAEKK